MIPTLLGISFVCFLLIQLIPGGPVEQKIAQLQMIAGETGGADASKVLSADEIANIKAHYGFDKPFWERYFTWLVNVTQLDFGNSYSYDKPVWDVVSSKFPISLFFGLTSFILSYLICIPLGVFKAVKNGHWSDTFSTVLIFAGYVIPGYALGILLLVLFSGGSFLDLFPLGGIVSDDFEEFTLLWKMLDFLHHMCLPMFCFMLGEFAFLTMLMKNSLLEETQKDYIRTAMAQGASYSQAIWKHGLRNALLPLATRSSEIFTLMFTGSLLIERVFDIDGMGLLMYNSMVSRDYNIVLGMIVMMSILGLLGRLFADILYVVIDPRVKL
jgi:microcin C transport system permease protein